MVPFYSAPLIGRQCVSGGRRAGCHVLCLILCAVLSRRETTGRCGRSTAPFDHSVTEDTRDSGLLIVSLRPGCTQAAMRHRRGERRGGFMGLKWQLHNSTLIQWTYTSSQDKDLTLGGVRGGSEQRSRKINTEPLILEGHLCHSQ